MRHSRSEAVQPPATAPKRVAAPPPAPATAPRCVAAPPPAPATWIHALARWMIRPLVHTPVTPNQLTTARLVTGILAAAMFAAGPGAWTVWGGLVFVLSAILDRADGELARLTGRATGSGHRYDTLCDAAANVLAFLGIGIGLRHGPLGAWAVGMGIVAGLSVGVIFWIVLRIEEAGGNRAPAFPGRWGFDPDDGLLLIGPLAWAGALAPLLGLAAIGSPLFALWTVRRSGWRWLKRHHAPRRSRGALSSP